MINPNEPYEDAAMIEITDPSEICEHCGTPVIDHPTSSFALIADLVPRMIDFGDIPEEDHSLVILHHLNHTLLQYNELEEGDGLNFAAFVAAALVDVFGFGFVLIGSPFLVEQPPISHPNDNELRCTPTEAGLAVNASGEITATTVAEFFKKLSDIVPLMRDRVFNPLLNNETDIDNE